MSDSRFSYFEIVVLTLLLGFLIFCSAPGYIRAGEDEKICNLIDALEQMRAQLALYQVQHNGKLPPCDSYQRFKKALTTEDGKYGPYVNQIPLNPFNGLEKIRFDGKAAGTGQAGWRLNTSTGILKADNKPNYAEL